MPQDHPDGTVPMQITGADKKLPTDFQDQYVGVHTEAEFETKQEKDKNFLGDEACQVYGGYANNIYTVPPGKTLYITGISWGSHANAAADYDHFLYTYGFIRDNTPLPVVLKAALGGIGFGSIPFTRPIAIEASHQVEFRIYNLANVTCDLRVTAWGYEV